MLGEVANARGLAVPRHEKVPLYQSPAERHIIGWTLRGATFAIEARMPRNPKGGEHLRITLGKRSSAFVRLSDVTPKGRGTPRPGVLWHWLPAQPGIQINQVADLTDQPKLHLEGVVTDDVKITDAYVSVRRLLQSQDHSRIIGSEYTKAFYQAATPETTRRMPFQADIPLWEGSNLVTVTVRGRDRHPTRRTYRVLRTSCRNGRPGPLSGGREAPAK